MAHLTLYRVDKMCSFIPHCLLTDLSIAFKSVVMKPGPEGFEAADGSLTHADYLKIHPNGLVPALGVDDQVITEMPAVLTYIASLAPERNLLGDDTFQRAKAAEWMAWLSGTVHSTAFRMTFRPYKFTDDAASHPRIREKGQALVQESFQTIDNRLKGKPFPLGDHETVVDFNLVVFWYWGREIGIPMAEKFPNYSSLVRRMESKQSVRSVANTEGLALAFE